ncbi:MAG: adenine phosphoribosyltransferase [Bacteroidetes bacterium]|jgi:adenine phosphoribosyltransferase|nr:adenine phosphoribosyltransferase [Bacteroidota bacterium]MBU1422323.1 adenine phosphoribosyltransferase [Bacteroidota bacterium]MBU2471585.1 adenine phosphoribosyltransferase [Bacteroidota bacterium]MBU2636253.1 adenine phosphoribosyltransferase [Bacteroidota bacterium]MDI6779667.1 adenine phosphoribosyltransferase [Bacteroidota bacterium]
MVNNLLKEKVRNVPDFPKKGIVFRDITTLLKDAQAFRAAVDLFIEKYKDKKIQKVVGIESRGYILGAALAYRLNAGFVPIRKPGKLPAETLREEYKLEYGTDAVEIHKDSINNGERILIHDDLLATGGTINAACKLVESLGGNIIGVSFLIELAFLNGRKLLNNYEIHSLITYDKE